MDGRRRGPRVPSPILTVGARAQGANVVAKELTPNATEFFKFDVAHDLEFFNSGCCVIVANRWSDVLADVADNMYTRALF